jgi:hypothetical protein
LAGLALFAVDTGDVCVAKSDLLFEVEDAMGMGEDAGVVDAISDHHVIVFKKGIMNQQIKNEIKINEKIGNNEKKNDRSRCGTASTTAPFIIAVATNNASLNITVTGSDGGVRTD